MTSTETVAVRMGFPPDIALALEAGCARYGLVLALEKAHMLAQVAHESNAGKWLQELASGKAYDTGPLAARLGNTPEADGDGPRYKGHGLIQVTGHDNHLAYSLWKYGDDRVLRDPLMLTRLPDAVDCVFWYWVVKRPKLKALALADDLVGVTCQINGGTNGLDDRRERLVQAKLLFEGMA